MPINANAAATVQRGALAVRRNSEGGTTAIPMDGGLDSGVPPPPLSRPSDDDAQSRDVADARKAGRATRGPNDVAFTASNLRRLFRRLDTDHNGTLSFEELSRGMAALGLSSDARGVAELIASLDIDRSGGIAESEFVSFFQHVKKQELVVRLAASGTGTGVRVTAVTFGNAAAPTAIEALPLTSVARWLDEHVLKPAAGAAAAGASSRGHLWLDVAGYDASLDALLSSSLGLHPQALQAALVTQKQGVTVAAPLPSLLGHAQARAQQDASPASPSGSAAPSSRGPNQEEQAGSQPPAHITMVLHASSVSNLPLRSSSTLAATAKVLRRVGCDCFLSGETWDDPHHAGRDAASALARAAEVTSQGAEDEDDAARHSVPIAHRLASRAVLLSHPPQLVAEQLCIVVSGWVGLWWGSQPRGVCNSRQPACALHEDILV